MIGWQQDKRWSDKFLHEIKAHIGQALICEPPEEEDQQRNTDLVVLRLDAVRIGCRVRKNDQMRYCDEFTIRSGRPSGVKTELTKIIEGWGDYFFYGFADAEENRLALWLVGDLKAFRIWYSRQLVRGKGVPPGSRQNNRDNSSSFHAFKWADIPGFVVASNHGERAAA